MIRRKRQKLTIACAPCRRRKVKCDGKRPACCHCQRRATQAECIYNERTDEPFSIISEQRETDERKRSFLPQKAQEDGVEASDRSRIIFDDPRHKAFSDHRLPLQMQNTGIINQSDPDSARIYTSSNPKLVSGEDISPGREATAMDPPRSLDNPPLTEPEGTDSMNGVTGDPTCTPEVFGSSSAGSFMRQIQSAINAQLGVSLTNSEQKKTPSQQLHDRLDPLQYSADCDEPALFTLPLRGLADGLMQAYWDNNWSLYPVINRGRIEATYESLWVSHNVRNYPIMPFCVINLCFAIGCHYCALLPPRERKASSDDFFSRAESLYKKTGDVVSYERVQCLLLFGIYLQSTTSVSKCWMTVGQAIRMAQSLGIHLANHGRVREPASQREYQRRIWHGCVWLDRVLSSTLGRPGMIPNWLFDSVPLPSMIDDEFFESQTQGAPFRPDGRPCRMAFVVKAMELYQILDEILVDMYLKGSKDDDFESKLKNLLRIDGKLQAWKNSLPEFLRPRLAIEDDEILKRQAMVLRVRFLHARILLFRPTVIYYCVRSATVAAPVTEDPFAKNNPDDFLDDSSLSSVMLAESARICFRVARELIEIFDHHLNRETLLGPLPNWWYSVLYVYNATMMILVERFLEAKDVASPTIQTKAELTWNAALRVLKSYGIIADSAARCAAVLEIFLGKIDFNNTSDDRDADTDRDTVIDPTAQNGLDGFDWNTLWAMSDSFGWESSLTESLNLFPFTMDDFLLSDLLSVPLGNGPGNG